jgi:hypothetical protein
MHENGKGSKEKKIVVKKNKTKNPNVERESVRKEQQC